MKDRIEEYLDGLLAPEEARAFEAALEADPALRAELEEARRLAGLLEALAPGHSAVDAAIAAARARQRWLAVARWGALAAAAAVVAAVVLAPRPEKPTWAARIEAQSLAFGRRLGAIAEERRLGRVPRVGVGDLEVPPAAASGMVFRGALAELGIELPEERASAVSELVMRHHLANAHRGRGLAAECARAEAELALYRDLRRVAGDAVADAYYDVFRPALADADTTRRVRPGTLGFLVDNAERYRTAYRRALAELTELYGEPDVQVVLDHLAPRDRRTRWYDAAQRGVRRQAVLAIRAQLYQAACEAGADRLYVEG